MSFILLYFTSNYECSFLGFFLLLFHDRGPYYIETSILICKTNKWTGFYMIGTSFMKELKN